MGRGISVLKIEARASWEANGGSFVALLVVAEGPQP